MSVATAGVRFKRVVQMNVSSEQWQVIGDYVCDEDEYTTMVLSIIIANTSENEIFVSLKLVPANGDTESSPYIGRSIPIPAASTTVFGSEIKLIMEKGDSIQAKLDNGIAALETNVSTGVVGKADIIMNLTEMA